MNNICTHVFDTEFISDIQEQIFDTEFVTDERAFDTEFHSVVIEVKPEEQEKTVTITENGTTEVLPDENKLLNKVTVITDLVGVNAEEYKGSYEVTPSAREQVLETAEKVMRNDVTIKEIPYKETPNSSGRGTTVRIG